MNTIERGYAQAIGAGRCPVADMPEPVTDKAKIQGLSAKIISQVSLLDVKKDLQAFSGSTIVGLGVAVGNSVKRHAEVARLNGPYEELDALLVERAKKSGEEVVPHPSQERIQAGTNSGIAAETLTLATVQYANESGQHEIMTRAGLRASGRVPFSLALLHMTGYRGFTSGNWFDMATLAGGESVRVLKSENVSVDPEAGLRLIRELPKGAGDSRSDDPWVGCPVTLVKDFIYDLNELTVDIAIDVGILASQN